MKITNLLKVTMLALVASLAVSTAQAASIEGILNFSGHATPIPGSDLSDAIGLSFTTGFLVSTATGTFDANGIGFADIGTISDFFFNPLTPSPVNPLLTIMFGNGPGKFAYALESITVVDQSAQFLVLSGCGTLSGTGLDSTAYAISISVDGVGGLYAYSGSLAPKIVPIPGALILLISGLAALGIRKRD